MVVVVVVVMVVMVVVVVVMVVMVVVVVEVVVVVVVVVCYVMLWYGILEFNVPLDTVKVISETGALSCDVHLPFSNGGPAT